MANIATLVSGLFNKGKYAILGGLGLFGASQVVPAIQDTVSTAAEKAVEIQSGAQAQNGNIDSFFGGFNKAQGFMGVLAGLAMALGKLMGHQGMIDWANQQMQHSRETQAAIQEDIRQRSDTSTQGLGGTVAGLTAGGIGVGATVGAYALGSRLLGGKPSDGATPPGGGTPSGGADIPNRAAAPVSEFDAAKRNGQADLFDRSTTGAAVEAAESRGFGSWLKGGLRRTAIGAGIVGGVTFLGSMFTGSSTAEAAETTARTVVPYADAAALAASGDTAGAERSAIAETGAWAGFAAGATAGGLIGSGFFGLGAIPGAIIGGVAGIGGSLLGGWIGEKVADQVVPSTPAAAATPQVDIMGNATGFEVSSLDTAAPSVEPQLDLGREFQVAAVAPVPSSLDAFRNAVATSEIQVPESMLQGNFANARDNKVAAATPVAGTTPRRTRKGYNVDEPGVHIA